MSVTGTADLVLLGTLELSWVSASQAVLQKEVATPCGVLAGPQLLEVCLWISTQGFPSLG